MIARNPEGVARREPRDRLFTVDKLITGSRKCGLQECAIADAGLAAVLRELLIMGGEQDLGSTQAGSVTASQITWRVRAARPGASSWSCGRRSSAIRTRGCTVSGGSRPGSQLYRACRLWRASFAQGLPWEGQLQASCRRWLVSVRSCANVLTSVITCQVCVLRHDRCRSRQEPVTATQVR